MRVLVSMLLWAPYGPRFYVCCNHQKYTRIISLTWPNYNSPNIKMKSQLMTSSEKEPRPSLLSPTALIRASRMCSKLHKLGRIYNYVLSIHFGAPKSKSRQDELLVHLHADPVLELTQLSHLIRSGRSCRGPKYPKKQYPRFLCQESEYGLG